VSHTRTLGIDHAGSNYIAKQYMASSCIIVIIIIITLGFNHAKQTHLGRVLLLQGLLELRHPALERLDEDMVVLLIRHDTRPQRRQLLGQLLGPGRYLGARGFLLVSIGTLATVRILMV
jgi:hypothetical protein